MKNPSIADLPVDLINESPLNPRKTYGDLSELTESVRTHGILSPVLVRVLHDPLGVDPEPRYELVYGHRRHRAAKAAGLETIPALIRELDDRECLEIQVIENLQREDVHPLEEADGYKALHEVHGYSADTIAEKTGKSKAYVYGRMKLCVLAKAGRKAFYDGEISASVALLIARIPDAKLQGDAVRDFGNENGGESARWVGEQIQRNYMHRLNQAPFKMDDAELLAKAGACSGCPKLTGNQSELFSDVGAVDFCTDPKCYKQKLGAHWKVVSKKAKKDGVQVLDQKETEKIWPYGGQSGMYSNTYVGLSEQCWEDSKRRTYGKILGSSPEGFVLARHPDGAPEKLFPKKGLQSALKEAGIKIQARTHQPAAADKKHQTQQRNEREARRRTVTAIVEASTGKAPKVPVQIFRMIVKAGIGQLWDDARKRILDRREFGGEKDSSQNRLEALADQLSGRDLWALLVEIAITPDSMNDYDMGDVLKSAAALHDVDQAAILKEVRAEHQAKEKAKKKKKKKATKKVGKSTKKVGKKAAKKPAAAGSCSVDPCSNPTKTRDLCSAHYQKHRRLIQEGKPGLIT